MCRVLVRCVGFSRSVNVSSNKVELRNEIIRNNGDLKSVRETVKAFEIASEGSKMMKNGGKSTVKTQVIQS